MGALCMQYVDLVDQGRKLLAAMEKCYGVAPTADHYACMADLLDWAEYLDEAPKLVEAMHVKPNGRV